MVTLRRAGGAAIALLALTLSAAEVTREVAVTFDDLPGVPQSTPLAYFERQSQELFGRNIRHVLLVHANALNADWFDEVAASMKKRGYRFITLDRALEDPAYRSKDEWTGAAGGISWLHRWAFALGKKGAFFAGEPATPRWVLAAGVESE